MMNILKPMWSGVGSQVPLADGSGSADDMDMGAFCDAIANALVG